MLSSTCGWGNTSARIEFSRRIASGDASFRLYAILDAESCSRRNLSLLQVARAWREAGVQILQYRDKVASPEAILTNAHVLRELFPAGSAFLLLNDRPDLVTASDFDGAHVGQTDTAIDAARAHLGPDRILGISTHTADQALAASTTDADYLAIGPVFSTTTKTDTEPTVGLCGVQAARAVARKPLVAIGGIGLAQCRDVLQAGADSIALISALLPDAQGAQGLTERAQDILRRLK